MAFRNILIGAFGMLVLLALIVLAVIFTGGYNVAASEKHTAMGQWALHTTMENSVKSRAGEMAEPPVFTPAMVAAGAGEYKAMCSQCHGGPGAAPAEWTKGMLPAPPDLTKAAAGWQPREIFWMLRHGIKMSAMPAFGGTHDDKTLWSIAAFVKKLSEMTPAQYAAYPVDEEHDNHNHKDGHSEHDKEPPHEHGH